MLVDKAMRGIGAYAKDLTNSEMFGIGSPDSKQALELLLFSYALTNVVYLTDEDIKSIDTRISDIRL